MRSNERKVLITDNQGALVPFLLTSDHPAD